MTTVNRGARALELICSTEWLITASALEAIVDIATRDKIDIESLRERTGKTFSRVNEVQTFDRVAVVPFIGPVFRYANIFTEISGATSLEIFASQFQQAAERSEIDTIVINLDSPGGQANGISEMAQTIRATDKKVIAYGSNLAASAGYWIAAAADEIITADTGMVGSIGVVSRVSAGDSDEIKIVSSQSPLKQADIKTESGRNEVQRVTDSLAEVFVEAVAKYRNVDVEKVLSDFGRGGLLVGQDAVRAGMADSVGTLQSVIARYSGTSIKRRKTTMTTETQGDKLTLETLKAEHSDIYQAAAAEGAKAERERIQGVEALAMPGHEELIASLKYDGNTSPEAAAVQVLKAEKSNRENALETHRNEAPEPLAPSAGTTPPKALTFEDQIKQKWESDPEIREEFGDFTTFEAFEQVARSGQAKVLGVR